MILVRMRQCDSNQPVIRGLHALDLRQQIGARLRGIERQTHIEQQSSATVFEFNTGAADLLCTSMNADVHAEESVCSHIAGAIELGPDLEVVRNTPDSVVGGPA